MRAGVYLCGAIPASEAEGAKNARLLELEQTELRVEQLVLDYSETAPVFSSTASTIVHGFHAGA